MRDIPNSSFKTARSCTVNPICVAVAITPSVVAVRDTKDAGKVTLLFTPNEWEAFTKGVKAGEFDIK